MIGALVETFRPRTFEGPEAGTHSFRLVTYNVHRCRGLDRRTRPARIAAILHALGPDIVALQEVLGEGPDDDQAAIIADQLGMAYRFAPTRMLRAHRYGNALLSRLPIVHHEQHDLTYRLCEPRGCQWIDVEIGDQRLHVLNVHLGTAFLEHREQAQRLSTYIDGMRRSAPLVVLGDFNEWFRGATSSVLTRRLKSIDVREHIGHRRTYPGIVPLLHLDHIYFDGNLCVERVLLPRTRQTLIASDHLPLVADIRMLEDEPRG